MDRKLTAFGAARMDIFANLPQADVEAECGIDRRRCVIELGYGAKIPLKGIEYCVGGNAANLAVGMQRLGVGSMLIAELGEGPMADMAFRQLEGENIEMGHVTKTPGVKEGLGIVINYEAERTILSYYSPFRPNFPKDLPWTEWCYLTSMGEGFEDYYKSVLSWVKTNKVKLGFNPGGRQIKKGKDWMASFLSVTEILLVNREEAASILGGDEEKLGDVKKMLVELWGMGAKVVVITDGPGGAYVYNGQKTLHMPIFDVTVVERTGSGDAFSTGFMAAIISGHDMETAMKWGTVNSASVIGKIGPQPGLLRDSEMEEWVGKMKEIEAREL